MAEAAAEKVTEPNAPAAQPPAASSAKKQLVNALIREHGSANAALYKIASENKDLRQKNAALRGEEVDGLVMLKGDDAKRWQAFQSLQLEPAAITTALAEATALKQQNTALSQSLTEAKQERARDEAAAMMGYKPSVLAALEKSQGFRVEVRDAKNEKGETSRVAYAVTGEKDKEEAKPLAEYAASALSDFLPALSPSGGTTAPAGSPYPATPPKATGQGSKPGDVAARHMAQTYVTPSQRQREQQKQPAQ